MDFTKVDILSPAVGTLVANQYSNAQGLTDGFFNDFSELVFRGVGTTLHLNQAITDYLWLEIVLGTRNAQTGAGAYIHVYTMASGLTPAYTANPAFSQTGYLSEVTVRIPYIGRIEELGFDSIGAPIGADFSMMVKSIKVVKTSDNLTIKDAYAIGRATFTGTGPLAYDPVLGCFAGDVPFNTTINANLAFLALAKGSETGFLRIETVGQDGQTVISAGAPDGVLVAVGTPKVKYSYRAEDLTVFPTGVTIANLAGGKTAKVRVYLEIGTFLDQNVTAFGVNAQPVGTPPSLYNPLNVLIGISGWVFCAAGVATGFPLIPVSAVDFTAATIPVASVTNLNVVNLTVTGNVTLNDVKITRTGVAGGTGSIFFKDAAGYVTPSDVTKFAYRSDFGTGGAFSFGTAPVNSGILMNLDASQTGAGASGLRYGINLFARPTSVLDTGLIGYHSDLSAANAAYTLVAITHFNATQTSAAAPATINTAKGFAANNSIAKGNFNYGFWSDINNATNTYQAYLSGTAPNYIASELAMGSSSVSVGGSLLALYMGNAPLTGTNDKIAISIRGASTSAIVSNNIGIQTFGIGTPAAAITLANLTHYWAQTSVLGAGSTITSIYGFRASSGIAVGSNNYGFYSDINSAANTYQAYMAGTALSYFAAPIQVLSVINANFDVLVRLGNSATHPSASAGIYGIHHSWKSPATATTGMWGNFTVLATTASVYNTAELTHYKAGTTTLGAGSTATNVFGFYAASGVASVASGICAGYYTDIASGTNIWGFYHASTSRNYFGSGSSNFGSNSSFLDSQVVIQPVAVSGGSMIGLRIQGGLPASTTTGAGIIVYGAASANSQIFNMFNAFQNDNAGSFTGFNVRGFYASNASVSAAATGYGFYSDINAATSKYQLNMAGTAVSRFNGQVGLFTDPVANVSLHVSVVNGQAGAGQVGVYVNGVFPVAATSTALGFQAQLSTANTAVTYAEITGFRADTWTRGAASTITVASAFRVEDSFAAGTTSYGFLSNINDATTFTAKYGVYAAGSARNFLSKLGVGSTAFSNWTQDDRLVNIYGQPSLPSGGNIFALSAAATANATVTSAVAVLGYVDTVASAFSTDITLFSTSAGKGAGSTITNLYGFRAQAAIGGLATNTYGFRSDLASASNTFQFYAGGTAPSFFTGGLILNSTAAPTTAAGQISFGATTTGTVGAAGAAVALPANPTGYIVISVAGATQRIPYYN